MFEAVEFIEFKAQPTLPPQERVIGTYEEESAAVEAARLARAAFLDSAREDYAWWLVRPQGGRLARWIADSLSAKEFVLDLRTGKLVEVS